MSRESSQFIFFTGLLHGLSINEYSFSDDDANYLVSYGFKCWWTQNIHLILVSNYFGFRQEILNHRASVICGDFSQIVLLRHGDPPIEYQLFGENHGPSRFKRITHWVSDAIHVKPNDYSCPYTAYKGWDFSKCDWDMVVRSPLWLAAPFPNWGSWIEDI